MKILSLALCILSIQTDLTLKNLKEIEKELLTKNEKTE